jgi:hypothetical protein
MDRIRRLYFSSAFAAGTLFTGAAMSNERDRVISISLSEQEWQAFVARQPQPVDWLRERIRDEVNTNTPPKDTKNAA